MYKYHIIIYFILFFLGCNNNSGKNSIISPSLFNANQDHLVFAQSGGYIPWGYYELMIARDGSSAEVIPTRSAEDILWGYHINVVKFLETEPCTNCLWLSNIHLLPNEDVSVDVNLKHPFTDPIWTGFDVRGIIMFPSSQIFMDNNLRMQAGMDPFPEDMWRYRISNHDMYGDAELVNADGWTTAWSSQKNDYGWYSWCIYFTPPYEAPIYNYYPGKFASGDNLSTLSAFKRFQSTEVRHMFEVGKTVTRTYVIRPPASGPIKASYAVYAHWFPADNVPVTDPASDFGPRANSPLPYEFYITQDSPLDPDEPDNVSDEKIHWHIKTWSIGVEYWTPSVKTMLEDGTAGSGLNPHPNGEPDDYMMNTNYFGAYYQLPGAFPGKNRMLFTLEINQPDYPHTPLTCDFYIIDLDYAALDGEW
jgi:hypothetical protein